MDSTDSNRQLSYVCINCGHTVKELYKEYSASVLKIKNCDKCQNVADRYIECEPIIILIDLILLSQPAYRHILYNTHFRILWKLIVVILLLESYILWKDKSQPLPETYTLQSEEHFYVCFGLVVIEKLLFLLLFWICSQCLYLANVTEIRCAGCQPEFCMQILKSLTLASIAKSFLIPIMIWNNNTIDMGILVHLALVTGYYVLCLISVYSVLVKISRKQATVAILLIIMIQNQAYEHIVSYVKAYLPVKY